ncbi:DUF4387 family protein [Antarctobacter heliothermus]|uniref:DUF4387 domain-containing protein n=1 Tax=Antarctobacter heliothermus TaxID=74033 RepID=A0A239JPP9_9RHOB|nr:DUF4387 family protein [Antarctobacter heliothermus]SNT07800.1 protein of unknown function [Antarctobacter heliothermus]
MSRLVDLVPKVRSKNAGPFWLTVDVFCGTPEVFARVSGGLQTARVAKAFQTDPAMIKRFDMPDLNVVKFSLPRPEIQGTVFDRDMHGASFAQILGDFDI